MNVCSKIYRCFEKRNFHSNPVKKFVSTRLFLFAFPGCCFGCCLGIQKRSFHGCVARGCKNTRRNILLKCLSAWIEPVFWTFTVTSFFMEKRRTLFIFKQISPDLNFTDTDETTNLNNRENKDSWKYVTVRL